MRFRPAEHIRRRADFELAYDTGLRVNGRYMTVFARRTAEGPARLGIAATRKLGGAVTRNRAKRLVRELFRHYKPDQPLDVVVVPRREFLDAPYSSLEREFAALMERAASSGPRAAAGPRRAPRTRAASRV